MANFNPRRFAQPAVLKAIAPKRLLDFLEPHPPYFASRGLKLPLLSSPNGLDYDPLVSVFMSSDTDTPSELLNALFYVNEMSTEQSMDVLLEEAESNSVSLDGQPDPTPADVAVQVYLKDQGLLERKHAEQYLIRPRSFDSFKAGRPPDPLVHAALRRDVEGPRARSRRLV